MADYAGAVAAMRARFVAAFTQAPIAFQNEKPPATPWPPASPWVYFEVIETDTQMRGVGLPGNKVWLTLGNIFVHVFAPKGYGLADHLAIAKAAGDVFRAATFYDSDPGARVTCFGPSVRGGDSNADDGNAFALTVTIPFEFFFNA